MPKTKAIIILERVTDCDTGLYRIGEINFGIHSVELDEYLKAYGYEGKAEIVKTLGYLIYEVEKRFRDLPQNNAQVGVSSHPRT